MKIGYYTLLIIAFSLCVFLRASSRNRSDNSYFPVKENTSLIYETSFGECITKYLNRNSNIITQSEGDRFKYYQELMVRDDGTYVKETYQYIKLFLFIKKEAKYTYNKPLLRLPAVLKPGLEWAWEGIEYCNDDSSKIVVKGKVLEKEVLATKAGNFDSYKVETKITSENGNNVITEWYSEGIGLIKAKIVLGGGGIMGAVRDILGYGTIEFNLKEIKRN